MSRLRVQDRGPCWRALRILLLTLFGLTGTSAREVPRPVNGSTEWRSLAANAVPSAVIWLIHWGLDEGSPRERRGYQADHAEAPALPSSWLRPPQPAR
jgi:hypothetical protein